MRPLGFPALLLAGCSCHPPVQVQVSSVHDGDTFDFSPPIETPAGTMQDSVRLLCIDAPEVGDALECYGHEARDHLAELLDAGDVTLHFDRDCTDTYGRWLAWVVADGVDVNTAMAEDGYALMIDDYFADYPGCDAVRDAVDRARTAGAGGWGRCHGEPWTAR